MKPLIVILGPTAVGKTNLAAHFAYENNGEVISADSRQVYKGMNIGTGKDLSDYIFVDKKIPYHLIDILNAGERYDLFHFQQDFYKAYQDIQQRGKLPILCGGTPLYVETALAKKQLQFVPQNKKLRESTAKLTQNELNALLRKLKPKLHNTTDLIERERTIRALEIAQYEQKHPKANSIVKANIIFGIYMERQALRQRIKERMIQRFKDGMIEEVEDLMKEGLTYDELQYYGLEYRFIAQHIKGELNKKEIMEKLLQAIRRFAKKQMTWYRRMERKGFKIHWIPAEIPIEEKVIFMKSKL